MAALAAGLDGVCVRGGGVAARCAGGWVEGTSRGRVRCAGLAGGGVTVISGTGVVPGGTAGGPGAVGSAPCEGVCCVGCPAGGAGVGAVVAGVCCWAFCVCAAAILAQQLSNTSDELLKSSKRLLRLNIFDPDSFLSKNEPPLLGHAAWPRRLMRSAERRCAGCECCRGRNDCYRVWSGGRCPSFQGNWH